MKDNVKTQNTVIKDNKRKLKEDSIVLLNIRVM